MCKYLRRPRHVLITHTHTHTLAYTHTCSHCCCVCGAQLQRNQQLDNKSCSWKTQDELELDESFSRTLSTLRYPSLSFKELLQIYYTTNHIKLVSVGICQKLWTLSYIFKLESYIVANKLIKIFKNPVKFDSSTFNNNWNQYVHTDKQGRDR